MSQKANPTLIGAFVLGAIALAIGAVVFFGSAGLFSKKQTFLTYFNQSVSGLGVGSNVKFKGVTVGKVSKVLLSVRGDDEPSYVKVFYEVDTDLVVKNLGANVDLFNRAQHEKAVQSGLRAKLDFESLISGQLYVSVDRFRDPAPPEVPVDPRDSQYLIIPSQPSDIEAILGNLTKAIGNLGNIDFLDLAKQVSGLVQSAKTGIDEMHLADLGKSLNQTSESLNRLVGGDEVKGTLESLHTTVNQLNTTLKNLDNNLQPAMKNLSPTLEEAKRTLVTLQKTVGTLNTMLKPNSGLRYQLDSSLSQIGSAAASIQNLSDFLQRHPNSLIFGRHAGQAEKQ
ncbi:MAG TPA: MlaD family protein [Chthoniobacterales bacterium]